MKQPHTESDIRHTDDQQNTGTHRKAPGGPDRLGGTRTGAENVEPGGAAGQGRQKAGGAEVGPEPDERNRR